MEGSWNARRWRILAFRTLGGVAALLVLLLAAILLTQSHLQGPIVRYVAAQSQRQIRVDGRFQVELLSLHPGIVAERVTIGNPPWMPPGVTAEIGHLELTYDLPSIRLRTVVMEQATLHLTREENGHSNWQARPPGSGRGTGPPLIRSLRMPNARVYFDDARRRLKFDGTIAAQDLPGGGPTPPLRIEGAGQLNGRSVNFTLNCDPLATVTRGHPYRFEFVEESSGTRLTGKGTVPQPFDFHYLETTFESAGEDMKDLYFLTGVSLPETGSYHLTGKFTRQDHHLEFTDLDAKSGRSDMHGTVLIETKRGGAPSHTVADLRSQLLRLSDLGTQAAGRTPQPADGKQLMFPDTPFHLQGARRSDAEIDFHAQALEIGRVSLREVATKVKIDEGTIAVGPVAATLREGKVSGGFKIDVTHDVPWADVDLRVAHMKLGQPTGNDGNADSPPPVDGPLQARIALKGRGNSLHDLASNATGTVTAVLPHGTVRSSLAELAGFDLRGLGLMATGNKADTGIRCGVASFDVKDGTLTAQRLLVDTDPVLITGEGTIDLDSEALDLQLEGRPKHPRLRIRAPLLVRGTLKHPAFSTEAKKPMAQAGGAIALGVLLTPVAAMLAFVDPGLAKDSDCGALLAEVKAGGK
ncbi:MAG: AsmA family protein [Gammaproteobacteria bacterium]|nr:AsmA family protein [Gammaproteobacteria bacterium]